MSEDAQFQCRHTGILQSSLTDKGCRIRIATTSEDPAWDDFLARTPGGHYVQTSLWAKAKALLNWRAVRVVVMRDKHVVAGAQMLIRSLPLYGAVGYVSKGPLSATSEDDFELTKHIIDQLHKVAKTNGVQYLAIQPPNNGEALAQYLPSWGFEPSSREIMPTATVLLDLSLDLDEILSQMRKKTRQYIRRGLREEIAVRLGSRDDLPAFYRLLVKASERRNYTTYSEAYFSELWDVFKPHNYIQLFLAEYKREAVAALLVMAFGDTVVTKTIGWSGLYGDRQPNELLYWKVIEWAKAQGYRFYDFEGIEPEVAKLVAFEEALPDSLRRTPSFFKLGFGGQVTLLPQVYDHIYNPFLRWGYTSVLSKVSSSTVITRVEDAIRGIRRR